MTGDYKRACGKSNKQERPYALDNSFDTVRKLAVTVLFTGVPGTVDSLRKAARLARDLRTHIRVLVPHVVPYPLPIDRPASNPEFRLRRLHAFCEQEPIETIIEIRYCRDADQCIHAALGPHSLVVLGGCESWWPWSPTKRLARSLRREGHQVVFVGTPRSTP